MELLSMIPLGSPHYVLDITYFSHSLEPVCPCSGPSVNPSRAYDDVKADEQFDIILVPGGPNSRPDTVPSALTNFLKRQAPGARYILSVCTGSWILAGIGLLDGVKATSNKSVFKALKEATQDRPITWVAKARWVVSDDNKIWTSSGVTAGMDLAGAFLEHLIGREPTKKIRGVVELSTRGQEDDEFAAYYSLLED